MASTPLVVAIAAMGLLVVSVGFEVAVHRTYSLDVRVGDDWQTIGQSGAQGETYRAKPLSPTDPVVASRNDTIDFRLRVDNEYPWGFSERYYVNSYGPTIAEGEIVAPARGEGESTFRASLDEILGPVIVGPDGKTTTGKQVANLNVMVANVYLYGSFYVEVTG